MTAYVPGTSETDLRKIVMSIQQLAAGRSNAVGTATLTANATSTVVSNANCSSGSTPILTAMTANAAAEVGAGTLYVSDVANGSFTIRHANNAQTDRTFRYAIIG